MDAFAEQIDEQTSLEWDGDRVVERTERRLGGVVLEGFDRRARPDDRVRAMVLARVARDRSVLSWTPAVANLVHRVALLHGEDPDRWPAWSEEGLRADLGSWLAPWISGSTSLPEVTEVDLVEVLRTQLGHEAALRLDAAAPVRIELPSGRSVMVDYSAGRPTVSARVQEFFGTTATPTVAGRPVLVELLSPADRPVQVTDDLGGFWTGSWTEVRKEMAGRYPKHEWPEDPSSAPPHRS